MKNYRLLLLLLLSALSFPAFATTYYVRTDGGTRYSSNFPNGQCNGQADAAYLGSGVNQSCAFKDVRSLWTDGLYCGNSNPGSSCWGWIGQGGDTYILRGSIADGVSYRIGQSGPNSQDYYGLAGDPYGSGAPPPPSGTATNHTKILGGNFASCSAPNSRTQLNGGYGTSSVLTLQGVSYVDVACLDITDFSSCGKHGQVHGCQTYYPLDDYANVGVSWSRTSTNDTLNNVRIHGMASDGMYGPTGDGVVMSHIDVLGNPGAGWNADDGTTGTGSLLVQNYDISWNGCAEEYPVMHTLPYQDCTDENTAGYGDGFGTRSTPSSPAWNVTFDQGIVSYNTQDGLDALHLTGAGSTMVITRTRAFGNMGQQIKVGGAGGIARNNILTTNCNAMRQAIPGTPSGYNSRLSVFCRASDAGIVVTTGRNSNVLFENNTIYSASSTGIELDCDTTAGSCDSTSTASFQNNIFIGFLNNTADGYPGGGTGDYSNPIFFGFSPNPLTTMGAHWRNNFTFHPKSTWTCGAQVGEQAALCSDPQLTDESWHVYGDASATPLPVSPANGAGVFIAANPIDFSGATRPNPPTTGALEPAPVPTYVGSSEAFDTATYACAKPGNKLVAFALLDAQATPAPTLAGFTLGPVSHSSGGFTVYGYYGGVCVDTSSHTYSLSTIQPATYNNLQVVEFTSGTYAGAGSNSDPDSGILAASVSTSASNGAGVVFGYLGGSSLYTSPSAWTLDPNTDGSTVATFYNNTAFTSPGTVDFEAQTNSLADHPAVVIVLH